VCDIECPSPSVKESDKLILDPHPDVDQDPKLIISRESTSNNVFVSYPGHRMTDATITTITPPALAE